MDEQRPMLITALMIHLAFSQAQKEIPIPWDDIQTQSAINYECMAQHMNVSMELISPIRVQYLLLTPCLIRNRIRDRITGPFNTVRDIDEQIRELTGAPDFTIILIVNGERVGEGRYTSPDHIHVYAEYAKAQGLAQEIAAFRQQQQEQGEEGHHNA